MIERRSFGIAALGAALVSSGAVRAGAQTRGSTAIDLARAYYQSYNQNDWLAMSSLLSEEIMLHSNSGYFVQDTPFVNGMTSGHDETASRLTGADKVIDYLRTRRTQNREGFNLSDPELRFLSPEDNFALAWVFTAGGIGPLGIPLREVHVFECDIRRANSAIVSAKVAQIFEINLQKFLLS